MTSLSELFVQACVDDDSFRLRCLVSYYRPAFESPPSHSSRPNPYQKMQVKQGDFGVMNPDDGSLRFLRSFAELIYRDVTFLKGLLPEQVFQGIDYIRYQVEFINALNPVEDTHAQNMEFLLLNPKAYGGDFAIERLMSVVENWALNGQGISADGLPIAEPFLFVNQAYFKEPPSEPDIERPLLFSHRELPILSEPPTRLTFTPSLL